MGLLLQIIGVLVLVASIVLNIIALVNGTSNTVGLVLLIAGGFLVRIGRVIYNHNK